MIGPEDTDDQTGGDVTREPDLDTTDPAESPTESVGTDETEPGGVAWDSASVELPEPDALIDPTWDDLQTTAPRARADRLDLPPLEGGWHASRVRLVAWARRIITQPLSSWLTLAIVAGSCVYILTTLHPDLLLRNTTPTGGDMGAHVWGPMYLMRHVLPHWRFTGWTPDWYAGFPAFGYYMVGPAYAIVALTKGASGLLVVPAVLIGAVVSVSGFVVRRLFRARKVLVIVGLFVIVVSIPVPYNLAFKWVTVAGLITMPLSAWAFAKLADLRFPAPPVFAVAALVFVYNREPLVRYPTTGDLIGTGNIIGGNMLSTMAGEYSFSIAMSLTLVYLGVLARALRTGRHRGLAAGLLALVALCHLLPFFFALLATAVLFAVRPSVGRVKMIVVIGAVAGCLAAFWMLPFYWYRSFTIDMGFEQLPPAGLGYGDYLFPSRLTWMFLLAGVGVVVALAYRNRIGQMLLGCLVACAVAFRFMPQIQLWNARILPFYYLSLMLLAAFGVSGVIFSLSSLLSTRRGHLNPFTSNGLVAAAAIAGVVFVGIPLHHLPGGSMQAGQYHFWRWSTTDSNPAMGWAAWNYEGYEGRTAPVSGVSQNPYAEYKALIDTMARLGNDPSHGCGRAMWEADNQREGAYGTPMALMLLPYWTDSCIGSMEGLYFESSATTPYHFIDAAELSAKPSNPMRGLPYPGLDVASGVAHMRLLGVKYYLADSPSTIAAADALDDLEKVAVSGPWHIYQITDSSLVVPLTHEPVVWNVADQAKSSVQPSVDWFLDPTRWDVPFAFSGPKSWKRVDVDVGYWDHSWSTLTDIVTQLTSKSAPDPLPRVTTPKVPKAKVSNIAVTTNTVAFDVDRIGTPIRVKVSYFPNWKVSGAKGPYRITPNQMVVIPTSHHVELTYGRTPVNWTGIALLFVGLAALFWLSRRPAVAVASPWYARLAERRDEARRQRRAARESVGDDETEPRPLEPGEKLGDVSLPLAPPTAEPLPDETPPVSGEGADPL